MTRAHLRITVAAIAALLTSLLGVAVTAPTASATYDGKDGRIAFVRHDQIYTIRPDGTGLHRLTSVGTNSHPKWSPTGRRIAFVHETSAGATDLWVMSATGSAKRQVTHLGSVTEPTWSPHGKYLAFGGVEGLQKVRSTAPFGSPTVLSAYYTNTSCCGDELPVEAHALSVDRFVAWSPDGSRIAVWNHDSPQFDDVLWMYYPRTGEARTYLETGAACCGNLDVVDLFWGPTGTFGYAATDNDEEPQPSTIVYPGYVGEPGDTGPAPDPAGAKIALTNPSSGRSHIYVQAIDGAHRSFLTCGSQPDWQAIR
jgi:dipeptidyl aminopeptidase/acylaminoacyl peptidase